VKPFVVTAFSGSAPRSASHVLRPGAAAYALDCLFEDGTLDSWRAPRVARTVAPGTRSTYQNHACCWLDSTCDTAWAESAPELATVYATQYNNLAYPVRIKTDVDCTPVVKRLGLPCPPDAPNITAPPDVFSRGSSPRQYAFRWVDSAGGRSALSPPSALVVVEDGANVQVSGWVAPATWDIVAVEICRTLSGYESVTKLSENKIDAAWMVVGEVPVANVSFVDSKFDADLFEAVRDDVVEPPPDGLRGLLWVHGSNVLAGFVGNKLFFSENNAPHNWPHYLTLDDNIKAIGEVNGTIYVATDGHPYVVQADANCETAACRQAVRMPESLPMVGCCTNLATTPSGAVYPSRDGLVMMSGRGAPDVVTAGHYSPGEWQALRPDHMTVAYYLGRLFAFSDVGAFTMAIKEGAGTAAAPDHHTSLSARATQAFVTRTGRFYLLHEGQVLEWNAGTTRLQHTYVSGEVLTGVRLGLAAALAVLEAGGPEEFTLFSDREAVHSETLHKTEAMALSPWANGSTWQFQLQGVGRVKMVSLATSMKEL
jgi:hypothetical protein